MNNTKQDTLTTATPRQASNQAKTIPIDTETIGICLMALRGCRDSAMSEDHYNTTIEFNAAIDAVSDALLEAM